MSITADILCLGTLSRGPMTGYEIRKMFDDGPLAHMHSLGYGSIYPALKRLADNGDLLLEDAPAHANAGEMERKTYRITDQGLARLKTALTRPPRPDKKRSDLFFILWLAEFLPPGHARRLIDDRISHFHNVLAEIAQCDAPAPGEQLIHGFAQAIYAAGITYLETEGRALAAEIDQNKEID